MGNADSSMDGLLNSGCRIVVLGSRSSEFLTHLSGLPQEARILATGVTLEQLQKDGSFLAEGNVLLHIDGDAETVQEVIDAMPFLMWIHTIHSGVEELLCPSLLRSDIIVTDSRGCYSDLVAEHVMGLCSHFAKDMSRVLPRPSECGCSTIGDNAFRPTELRGKTMGIVGYGANGAKIAFLAKAYGMNVVAMRRHPEDSDEDLLLDEVMGF
jgi:phosphoglycerate dehydrogenase-like enzyme